ncbi:MAG: type III polyketide synthase [Bacteroidetes bacterium]|nr:type III polyketide synthase [Bacteroidota bacterium]MBS1933290.1 type III polyketide synthase [Bacteroidota bacterium]
MSKIISIGTALPSFRHKQDDILHFMQHIYAMNENDKRKLKFLYHQSSIEYRYSVIPDYSRQASDWKFYPHSENLEPFPSLEQRMSWYNKYAAPLSIDAIRDCIGNIISHKEITHLITVSCTGMSAPGLDLQVMELMDLPKNIFRTSINFMGCYAAIHAMKLADAICNTDINAKVLIVATELCTLHFQRENTIDNIASSLLFADGSAATLIVPDNNSAKGIHLEHFYSEVVTKGKKDMAWELSSTGFLMTLSGYVPNLIEEDFEMLTQKAFLKNNISKKEITHWCIHPGGKKIIEAIQKSLRLTNGELDKSYEILKQYGNMSSPTILFVLKKILPGIKYNGSEKIFGTAFGPGLTMETFLATA